MAAPHPLEAPCRKVLEGVPRVGFYDGQRCPEDVPFPSCLRACLEFLGENYGCGKVTGAVERLPLGCTYAYLMAMSGAAFRLLWNPGQWDMANTDIAVMAWDYEEPFRRAMQAAGCTYEMVGKAEGQDGEAVFRRRIAESIAGRGVPVLAFGVVGPPEVCLVTGYDDEGAVLTGWSYFQGFPEFAAGIETEPCGYFRKAGWYDDTPGLLVITGRCVRPPLAVLLLQALEWAQKVVRTPEVHCRRSGSAAYQAWADDLLDDAAFAVDDLAVLRDRYLVHFDATGCVAEGRWYAARFLRRAAELRTSMSEPLLAAVDCYEAEHDLMWQVWNLAGGNAVTDDHVRSLAKTDTRRAIAPLILQARDKDIEAADHLRRALQR